MDLFLWAVGWLSPDVCCWT